MFCRIREAEYQFHPEQWAGVGDAGKDFVSKLLVADPRQRMSAGEALAHPWIRNRAQRVWDT